MLGLNKSQWWHVAKGCGLVGFSICGMVVITDLAIPFTENAALPQVIGFTAAVCAAVGIIISALMFILSKPVQHTVGVLFATLSAGVGAALGNFITTLY